MFLYNNFLYYNTPTNPDGTKFELPSGAKLLNKEDEEYINGLTMIDIAGGNVIDKWKVVIYDYIYKGVKFGEPKTLTLFRDLLSQSKTDSYIASQFTENELIEIGLYLRLSFTTKGSKIDKVKQIREFLINNV